MSNWIDINFQDAFSPVILRLTKFHDHIMSLIVLVSLVVSYFIVRMIFFYKGDFSFKEDHKLEVVWTLFPIVILISILVPSIRILYFIEEVNPTLRVKAVGHQWFWRYEFSDFKKFEFDSYISSISYYRLLDTSVKIALPYCINVRIITTSIDVIHSWTVPSLGVKSDAVPGRINQMSFLINQPGLFYGQCSEICGANHSFIPINIESIRFKDFLGWMKKFLLDGWNLSYGLLSQIIVNTSNKLVK